MSSTSVEITSRRTRATWFAAGALAVLVLGVVLDYLSTWQVFYREIATKCSADGRVCVEWNRPAFLPGIGAWDRYWISVDMHDNCGSFVEAPFALNEKSFDPAFTRDYVEIEGPDGTAVRYPAVGC